MFTHPLAGRWSAPFALAFVCLLALPATLFAASFTWNGSGSWTTPTSWTPARNAPASSDVLVFDGAITPATTPAGIPVTPLAGQLRVIGGAAVTLTAPTASGVAFTLAGASGADLDLAAGTLALSGANAVTIALPTGTAGSVSGTITVAGGAHRVTATDAGALTFNAGAAMTTLAGFSGSVFGTTALNSVVFASGALYTHNAGASPFGASAPGTVVVFQSGSKAVFNTTSGFAASGRTYADLELDGGSAFATSGGSSVAFDNLTLSSTSSWTHTGSSTATITIHGNISTTGVGLLSLTPGSGGIQFNGGTLQTIDGGGSGSISLVGNATVASGTTLQVLSRFVGMSSGTMTVKGAFRLGQGGSINAPSNFTYTSGATLEFAATSGSYAVSGTSVFWPATNGPTNVTVYAGSGITMSVARTVSGTMQTAAAVITGGQLTLNGITQMNAGGSFTGSPVYGPASTLVYAAGMNVGAEWAAGSAVGTGVPRDVTVQAGAGTVQLPAADRTVPRNLTITSGTLAQNAGGGDLYVGGDWNDAGTFALNGRSVVFNGGAGSQTITKAGGETFAALGVAKSAGNLVLASNVASPTLTFTGGGRVVTGTNVLTAPEVFGATATRYVYGTLAKPVVIDPVEGFVQWYEIGDATAYAPVSLRFAPAPASSGTVLASTSPGDHAQIATSGFDAAKTVNRTWTLTHQGVVPTTFDAAFHFVDADVDAGTDRGALGVRRYSGGAWSPIPIVARTDSMTVAMATPGFGDFQIGQLDRWLIVSSAGPGGGVNPGTATVDDGSNVTFTITPDAGHKIAGVNVDGVPVGPVASYTFTNVTANHTLDATFAPNVHLAVVLDRTRVTSSGTDAGSAQHFAGYGAWHEQYPSAKAELYISPAADLGGAAFNVADIATVTYHTYNVNNPPPVEYFMAVYTTGTAHGWYGQRLNAEPYLKLHQPYAPLQNAWSAWTTDAADPLTFFDSNNCGNQGFYGAPTLAQLQAGPIDWAAWPGNPTAGVANPAPIDYASQGVALLSFQTGGGWSGFDGWLDGITIALKNGDTYDVDLEASPYTLTATAGAHGSVAKSPDLPGYAGGAVVSLAATPDPGWHLDAWSGDAGGNANPVSVTMDGDKTVTASFTIDTYTIAASAGAGGTIAPAGTTTVNQGDDLTYAIAPEANHHVADVAVDGASVGAVTAYTFTHVTANHTIDATFALDQHALVLTVNGGGTIGSPGLFEYDHGTVVTLTADPLPGYHFVEWSQDLSGTASPITITIDADRHVTATFAPNPQTLAVSIAGSGTVSRSPDQATYDHNSHVTLTATPAPGWTFVEWSGDASGGANPLTLTMDGDKAVTATFAINTYTLAVTVTGSGTVARSPDQASYDHGSVVTLTATPDPGWAFTAWGGDAAGNDDPLALTMDGNKTVSATFAPAVPVVAIAPVAGDEGNSGTTPFTFSVTLSEPTAVEVTIDWHTADLTATVADADYVAAAGTLHIPAGATTGTIDVLVNGDVRHEADETFAVRFSSATGATLVNAGATGTIRNDDDSVAPGVTVLAPNGGTPYPVGMTLVITYHATDDVGVTSVDVLLSRSGPAGPFETLAAGVPSDGGFPWLVTGPPTDDAWVKVVARDTAGNEAADVSDAAFAIIPRSTGAGEPVVTVFALSSIAPNPVVGEARIDYALPRAAAVRLSILDVQGRVVATLVDGVRPVGRHSVKWERGGVAAGVYFVRYEAAGKSYVKRLMLLD